jgi:hypothetical protein
LRWSIAKRADLCPRPAELQRAEGELVEHGRVEQLHVRILEHQPDPAPEREIRLLVLQPGLGKRLAERLEHAPARKIEPVQQT